MRDRVLASPGEAPVTDPAQLFFYGDLNCPFCYVEHERLVRLGLHGAIPFKGVEHWDALPTPWDTQDPTLQAALDEELERLGTRAPDVTIRRPPGRSNSRLGLAALVEAERLDPDAGVALRTALFRALWSEARDISTQAVVASCWRAAGLPGEPPELTRDSRRRLRVTLTEWRQGPFDQRIPVLASQDGHRLLGLADLDRLESFLLGADAGGHLSGVCRAPRSRGAG